MIFGKTEIQPSDVPSAISLVACSGASAADLGILPGQAITISTEFGDVHGVFICNAITTQLVSNVLTIGVPTSDVDTLLDATSVSISGVKVFMQYVGYHTHSFDAFRSGITAASIYDVVYAYAIDENPLYYTYSL